MYDKAFDGIPPEMFLRALFPTLLALALAGCAAGPVLVEPKSWEEVLELPPKQAWDEAQLWPQPQWTSRHLELVEHWADNELWDAVAAGLRQLEDRALQDSELQRLQQVKVRWLAYEQKDAEALALLETLPQNADILETQLQIYERQNDQPNALRVRLLRASNLPQVEQRLEHYQSVWNVLLSAPAAQMQAWRSASDDELWRGWLDLALLAQPTETPQLSVRETLREWQLHYPQHPAVEWLPEVTQMLAALHMEIRQIAALLPVSGELAVVGKAIRDGIEAGMRHRLEGRTPELRIYDTGDTTLSALDLYELAVADGAERVIGPFNKPAVMRLARQGALPVRTVSLNYLDQQMQAPENFYQFGLLPEDEAIQVAERALQDGYRAAISFAPNSRWGRRLHTAFTERFEAGGGVVRSSGFYLADAPIMPTSSSVP